MAGRHHLSDVSPNSWGEATCNGSTRDEDETPDGPKADTVEGRRPTDLIPDLASVEGVVIEEWIGDDSTIWISMSSSPTSQAMFLMGFDGDEHGLNIIPLPPRCN